MHIFVKVETQSSSDIDCKKSSHPDQLGIELGVCIASIKFPSYELICHFIIFYLVPLPPYIFDRPHFMYCFCWKLHNLFNNATATHQAPSLTLTSAVQWPRPSPPLCSTYHYTANVYRALQGLYRDIGVQGFQIYGDCMYTHNPCNFEISTL